MGFDKIYGHIVRGGIPVLVAVMLCFTSCVKEKTVKPASGDVIFQLQITRADTPEENDGYVGLTHEDKIKELHVLFFEPDYPYDFLEIIQAEQYGLSTDNNPLYKVGVAQGTYRMVLLANCGEPLEDLGIEDFEPGDCTLEDLQMSLTWLAHNLSDDGRWITNTSDPDFRYMPMWGEKESVTVDANGADLSGRENLVPMIRMLARIDVKLDDTGGMFSVASNYDIHSIRLYNWYTTAAAIPREDAVEFNYASGVWSYTVKESSAPETGGRDSQELLYTMSPAVSSYTASIYTFENKKPDKESGEYYEPLIYPSLVVGVSEKNKGSGVRGELTRADDPAYHEQEIWYYRMDFIDNNGEYLDILRNHNYTFLVKAITNQGFPEPEQALHSWIYDLDFEVAGWKDMGTGEYIPGNDGIYRLDVSSTYLEVNQPNPIYIKISTTHPDGLKIYASDSPDKYDPASHTSLTYINTTDWSFDEEGAHGQTYMGVSDPGEYILEFELYDIDAIYLKEVFQYLHIVSGNMTNVITVRGFWRSDG
ncbi:MAG: FimB/Mfa2 family fimbrial subunit [Alistipes sp.]|nr:FimB/Mfa2 family fimbrial subunit [Alistipes sp.]